jgi:hypothetical protein
VTISVGETVPNFTVHRRIREPVTAAALLAEGPAVFHFHVFDFTGGPAGG